MILLHDHKYKTCNKNNLDEILQLLDRFRPKKNGHLQKIRS